MLKNFRKKLKISNKEIISKIGIKGESTIYYIEGTFKNNNTFKYLLLLREKGVDINAFLDELIKKK